MKRVDAWSAIFRFRCKHFGCMITKIFTFTANDEHGSDIWVQRNPDFLNLQGNENWFEKRVV